MSTQEKGAQALAAFYAANWLIELVNGFVTQVSPT